MNNVFTAKLLQNLRNKKGNKGFTLIELLVVVIIIGVLAAIALPNLLGQVAKGRQAEARNTLGTINRSQQANRLEFGTFGNIGSYTETCLPSGVCNVDVIVPAVANPLPLALQLEFYQMVDAAAATPTESIVNATSVTQYTNDILDYQGKVTQDVNGAFASIICQEGTIGSADAGSDGGGGALVTGCTGTSTEVK